MEVSQIGSSLSGGLARFFLYQVMVSDNISLQLLANQHNELSKEDSPTCTQVYPMLEMLMSDWEELLEKEEYQPVHAALSAGIALLEKYYRCSDDTDAYFISHGMKIFSVINDKDELMTAVLDPTTKLFYLEVAWEKKYIDMRMKCLQQWVRLESSSSNHLHLQFLPVPSL